VCAHRLLHGILGKTRVHRRLHEEDEDEEEEEEEEEEEKK
jgi:hypothetical protein